MSVQLAGNDHLDEQYPSSRASAARFVVCRITEIQRSRTHIASMTAFLRSQLDRTRQPGYAQLAAGWCAQVGVTMSALDAGVLLEGAKTMNGRDSRPRTTTGAAAGFGGRTP
jgi:hypothetical protein